MDHESVAEIKRHFELVAEGLRGEIRLVDEKAERRSEELERRLRSEMQSGMQDSRTEMQSGMQDFRTEMQSGMQDFRAEVQSGMQDLHRHFDVVTEALRSGIRLVAEGVAGLDEKFTVEFVKVREEIAGQIGDVKSLIRASYGDLDRRVQALERKPS